MIHSVSSSLRSRARRDQYSSDRAVKPPVFIGMSFRDGRHRGEEAGPSYFNGHRAGAFPKDASPSPSRASFAVSCARRPNTLSSGMVYPSLAPPCAHLFRTGQAPAGFSSTSAGMLLCSAANGCGQELDECPTDCWRIEGFPNAWCGLEQSLFKYQPTVSRH